MRSTVVASIVALNWRPVCECPALVRTRLCGKLVDNTGATVIGAEVLIGAFADPEAIDTGLGIIDLANYGWTEFTLCL